MTRASLHLPAGTAGADGELVRLSPEMAGWRYCGLRVLDIAAGAARELCSEGEELALVPLSGSFDIAGEQFDFHLYGRTGVFSAVTDFAYLPPRTSYTVGSQDGGRLAIASARAEEGLAPAYGPADDVPVEIRGAGRSTRQVNNFMAPTVFAAEKLMAVEVLTPSGNWSSYPPHKHDEQSPGEAELEEIYYFELQRAGGGGAAGSPVPFGLHEVYTDEGPLFSGMVRSGDVVLVPHGYHGPSAAAPGYDMYYLNVLAGPAPERSMAFCDDPRHAWVRSSWSGQERDPRLPMAGAAHPTRAGARP